MRLDHDQVLHIAELAKLGMTELEIELFAEQLSAILDYAQMLNRLDTESIPPTAQAIAMHNIVRDDVICQSLPADVLLANAPQRHGSFFAVKPILD